MKSHFLQLTAAVACCLAGSAAFGQSWTDQVVDTKKIDFGVIATGSENPRPITISNTLQSTIHIREVKTSCQCAIVTQPSTYTLQPGESVTIDVRMNTRQFKQRKDSNVVVVFDSPQYYELRIPVTAYIRTDVVFDPGMIRFGNVDQGSPASSTVSIAYAGRNDWDIVDIKIENPNITATLHPGTRAAGRADYSLEVKLNDAAKAGRMRDVITLVTNDQSNPYVPLMIEGTIVPDLTVSQDVYYVQPLSAGQTAQIRVVVRGRRPFRIEDVDCETMGDCFKATITDSERTVHLVPIEFSAPNKPGKFTENMIVKIAGRAEPLRFMVAGVIN